MRLFPIDSHLIRYKWMQVLFFRISFYLFIYFSIWHLITVMDVTHCAGLRRNKWLPVDFWSPIVTVNSSDDFKRIKRCWSWRRMRSRLRGAQQTEITPPTVGGDGATGEVKSGLVLWLICTPAERFSVFPLFILQPSTLLRSNMRCLL